MQESPHTSGSWNGEIFIGSVDVPATVLAFTRFKISPR